MNGSASSQAAKPEARPNRREILEEERRGLMRGSRSGMVWLRVGWCAAVIAIGALECVSAEAQCTAYVATHKSNSVAVVDTALDRVVTVIPVQIQPLAVAITPDRDRKSVV